MINLDFKSVIELVKVFNSEEVCIKHLEELRWNGNVVSPFDPASKVYKCAGNKYRCKNTGKYFNVRTATLFDNTKVELQTWFVAIYLITSHKKGISSAQLARDLNVTQKTAWFMLQRIRNCFGIDEHTELNNDVEIDESYVGGKNKNKHASKRKEHTSGRSTEDKTPVLGMIERNGKVIAKVVDDVSRASLIPEITKTISQTSTLYTDEFVGYKVLDMIYERFVVNHSTGQYVDGKAHTNSIENFWSLLKRSIIGIYHFTSKKHLQKYVNEMAFRFNSRKISESERFRLLLANCNQRLTYQNLIK